MELKKRFDFQDFNIRFIFSKLRFFLRFCRFLNLHIGHTQQLCCLLVYTQAASIPVSVKQRLPTRLSVCLFLNVNEVRGQTANVSTVRFPRGPTHCVRAKFHWTGFPLDWFPHNFPYCRSKCYGNVVNFVSDLLATLSRACRRTRCRSLSTFQDGGRPPPSWTAAAAATDRPRTSCRRTRRAGTAPGCRGWFAEAPWTRCSGRPRRRRRRRRTPAAEADRRHHHHHHHHGSPPAMTTVTSSRTGRDVSADRRRTAPNTRRTGTNAIYIL